MSGGGRVEKRCIYPLPETYHLIRPEAKDAPPKVSELVMSDLLTRRFIAPTQPIDLSVPGAADNVDFVVTPAGTRALQLKGIEYEDTQEAMFGEEVGKAPRADMEAA